ncbi:ExeM/NucH family extracellular endonuclease [Nocardioides sp. NPDC059952]|uniref:ExeM/NucH family extracellular endonuclease n=1 Tax=Nocardioides sp. NPDC059952 TaxID=3347014 RepID=UPI00365A296A
MLSARSLLGSAVGLTVATAGLYAVAVPVAQATPAGDNLVISEVYGAGGNSGAVYNADFVELFNPTDEAIALNGLAIHYRSASGGSGGAPQALTGSVAAGAHYLIQMSAAGTTGEALPTPDHTASPAFSMAAAGGQISLQQGTAVVATSGSTVGVAGIVDFFGTSGATSFEGAPAGATATATQSLSRTGGADTDDNSADFTRTTPTPTPTGGEPEEPEEPGDPVAATPAEIQGEGTTSPLAGQTVITSGIVTAAYPSGGFSGFYLQTEGTGGERSLADHPASDAVFVYQTQAAGAVTAKIGDKVTVTGLVKEYAGLTEVEVSSAAGIVAGGTGEIAPVTTDWPSTVAQKESLEGMLFAPAELTVADTYTGSTVYGELGLASGDKPLLQPTEVARPGSAEAAAVAADNAARRIVLDDGRSTSWRVPTDADLPWVSNDAPIAVGASADLDPVIFTEGGSPTAPTYRLQPTAPISADPSTWPGDFENVRTEAPDAAKLGDAGLKVASFNVLNYFTTLGDADDDNVGDGGCEAYVDRAGDGNNVSGGCDQRGAWDPEDFERQQAKIVSAINALDADVVGLMEIENSTTLGEAPGEATESLVAALNAAAGAGTWAANPISAQLPADGMDVITNAIIYKPGSVNRVGEALALGDQSNDDQAFGNAREPIGQVFAPAGGGAPLLFVVNHFKSKGSAGPWPGDADTGDGQGASNESRVRQATALRDWVASVQESAGVADVALAGDFNSYTSEDPLQVLYEAGYADSEKVSGNAEYSYLFSGLVGSLDHILLSSSLQARVTGTDIWNVNSGEPILKEYSRYNYTGTDLHQNGPWRSSDHDPVVVGLSAEAAPVDVQVLATNDFHGRIQANGAEAGAALLSGAVKQMREENPNTVFAAAGDLIGASTFESFIQHDKPTIDALNEAGLEVSAVGNHEFDAGYDDLINRVMASYDAEDNPEGGAEWAYIGANVTLKSTGDPAVPATWIKEMSGVKVGFVGAVTEELPSLVSPAGIADLEVGDIVESTNTYADELKAEGADVVVMLVHEGAPSINCAAMDNPGTTWGDIVTGVNANVDAIVSGHTHLAYDCSFPVAEWADRAVTERPVVSAGQYGTNLNRLVYTVDPTSGEVEGLSTSLVALASGGFQPDAATAKIVTDAVAKADVLGAEVLGQIEAPLNRAKLANGTTENRGGESTLGNTVAEVQRWATSAPESGEAQIAFMNPGGLRADMAGTAAGEARDITYKQAALVQPFANTLVNMDLTGAQIKTVLEQQWQRDAAGAVPSRPFLRLGVSDGFTYTYTQADDPAHPGTTLGTVTGMWLDGSPLDPEETYSVTVNSFLASGGDNFRELANGAGKRDTGKIDLSAMVDYLADQTAEGPLPVDYGQRAVEVTFPASAPSEYAPGETVTFDLASLAMTGQDLTDSSVEIRLGDTVLGTAAVDNTIGTVTYDNHGTASVSVTLPSTAPPGANQLTVVGSTTGTSVLVPITVKEVAPQAPAWDARTIYRTGDEVTYAGSLWRALWWTTAVAPGFPYGAWEEIVTAEDGTAVWTPSRIFTAGDVVVHEGRRYEAKWWTRNQRPGDKHGPWKLLR